MPYTIKRTKDGMYVAKPGSERSYTNDRNQAHEFLTAQEAQAEACLEGESIWYDSGKPVCVSDGYSITIEQFDLGMDNEAKKLDEARAQLAKNHRCKDLFYGCQYMDNKGRLVCSYVGVVDENPELCPICGEKAAVDGRTKDGRVIRTCGDAHLRPDERKHYVTME